MKPQISEQAIPHASGTPLPAVGSNLGRRKPKPSPPAHLAKKLETEAWRFDIYALVDLLKHWGYTLDDLELIGHQGLESQPSFIRGIEFIENRVAITLYFGLAGANGVIPTYLMSMADKGVINDSHFHALIGFFDRYLLKSWLRGMMPGLSGIRADPLRWIRSVKNFRSTSSFHWLFGQVFPDLQVRVKRKSMNLGKSTRPAILGRSKIGIEMILGDTFNVLAYVFEVELIADYEHYKPGRPWHFEIQSRYEERLRPILRQLDIHIELWMILRTTKSWFKISEQGNYLGYERLKGGQNENKRILILSGYID